MIGTVATRANKSPHTAPEVANGKDRDMTPQIDLDDMTVSTPPADTRPLSRSTILAAVLAVAVVVLALAVALTALGKVPQARPGPAATRAPTRTVTISVKGAVVYYGLFGPMTQSGTAPAELLAVPVGTIVVAIAIVEHADDEAACSIDVDGQLLSGENGFGVDAVAECDVTVR